MHQAEYAAAHERKRGSATARGYGNLWRKRAAVLVAIHIAEHGEWCPGYGVQPHAATDFTVDHIVAKANGGTSDASNLRVLCRGCNSSKRDRL